VDQHTLRQASGAKRPRKRIGRGASSGQGTYAGRGMKGQKARGNVPAHFEGGQIPLVRRLGHKRGFRNFARVEFQAVNLDDLARRFEGGATIDGEALVAVRLIDDAEAPFKVLGRGSLDRAFTIVAPRLSAGAKEAITGAGGSWEELAPAAKRVRNRIHRRRALAAAAAAPTTTGGDSDAGAASRAGADAGPEGGDDA